MPPDAPVTSARGALDRASDIDLNPLNRRVSGLSRNRRRSQPPEQTARAGPFTAHDRSGMVPVPAETNSDWENGMDKQRYEAGLQARRKVLGDEYVDRALANATEFDKPFQELLTEFCWGACWGDDSLTHKQRSLLNLGMLAALNRMPEFEIHFRGALRNGLTAEELRAVCIQIAVYCGIPCGVECFKIARKVLDEQR